jgi:hypothetical protein
MNELASAIESRLPVPVPAVPGVDSLKDSLMDPLAGSVTDLIGTAGGDVVSSVMGAADGLKGAGAGGLGLLADVGGFAEAASQGDALGMAAHGMASVDHGVQAAGAVGKVAGSLGGHLGGLSAASLDPISGAMLIGSGALKGVEAVKTGMAAKRMSDLGADTRGNVSDKGAALAKEWGVGADALEATATAKHLDAVRAGSSAQADFENKDSFRAWDDAKRLESARSSGASNTAMRAALTGIDAAGDVTAGAGSFTGGADFGITKAVGLGLKGGVAATRMGKKAWDRAEAVSNAVDAQDLMKGYDKPGAIGKAVTATGDWMYDHGGKQVADALAPAGAALGAAGTAVYDEVLAPTGQALGAAGSAVYDHVLAPTGKALGAAGSAVYDHVLAPTGQALGAAGSAVYDNVLSPVGGAIGSAATSVYDSVLAPAGSAIGDAASWMYDSWFAPTSDAVGSVFDPVTDAMSSAGTWLGDNVGAPMQSALGAASDATGLTAAGTWLNDNVWETSDMAWARKGAAFFSMQSSDDMLAETRSQWDAMDAAGQRGREAGSFAGPVASLRNSDAGAQKLLETREKLRGNTRSRHAQDLAKAASSKDDATSALAKKQMAHMGVDPAASGGSMMDSLYAAFGW